MNRGDFWSRRQAAVAAEAKAQEQAEFAAEAEAREAELAEQSDEEVLAALELPTPESLGAGDDFKVFLTDQVPARIKNRALRHLWRANPVLACVDGLVDYGEDFTDAACVIEGLQTAYQVGKGMTKHVEALAQEAEAERVASEGVAEPGPQTAASEAVTEPQTGRDEPEPMAAAPTPAVVPVATEVNQSAPVSQANDQAELAARLAEATETQNPTVPRRMRFSFEGAAT
ncbi:DUF3306 domain-containing protein [Pseudophaeobacter sp.]|uniref:DUF3306 domain-containing protein n=1 Tax=Pseudophaeobacter sp. TaxID=1971739 RepID=UPI003296EB7C